MLSVPRWPCCFSVTLSHPNTLLSLRNPLVSKGSIQTYPQHFTALTSSAPKCAQLPKSLFEGFTKTYFISQSNITFSWQLDTVHTALSGLQWLFPFSKVSLRTCRWFMGFVVLPFSFVCSTNRFGACRQSFCFQKQIWDMSTGFLFLDTDVGISLGT